MRATFVAAIALVLAVGACSSTASEIRRREQADDGPEQLALLVRDDHARIELRRDAAIALTRIERRQRRVGLDLLLDALGDLPETSREHIVAAMAPELVRETELARPTSGDDRSLPAKDAVYAFLSRGLVADAKHKAELSSALLAWTQSTTLARLDDTSQRYSCEQAMRLVGAPAVRHLPELLPEATRVGHVVALVIELGDSATKDAARVALIAIARELKSSAVSIREGKLPRVMRAMKRLGGATVVSAATDATDTGEARALALGALQGHAGDLSGAQIDRVSSIARDEATPEATRDAAFVRLAELPNATQRLYGFFASKSWRARYGAALVVLRSMDANGIAEFMDHLPAKPSVAMDAREPLAYGPTLAKIGGHAALNSWLASKSFGARATALASHKGDAEKLAPYASDATPLPSCTKDGTCIWTCSAGKAGALVLTAAPTTLGEFVRLCLEPSQTDASGAGPDTLESETERLQKELLKTLGGAH
jgi:hypothetical protein